MSEGLYVPEEHLLVVCKIIRRGLKGGTGALRVPREVRQQLLKWCKESEEHINAE